MANSLITNYLEYASGGETPAVAHRWTLISCISAMLGRRVALPFQHKFVYPNTYISLMGPPASRKSTAIDLGQALLIAAGYNKFSPNNASIQGFWKALEDAPTKPSVRLTGLMKDPKFKPLADELRKPIRNEAPAECYIMIGELSDFIPEGDRRFITNLTNLYDCLEHYISEVVSRKTVHVSKPTINMLGGMPQAKLVEVYTSSAIKSGYFSRHLFINVPATTKQVTIPPIPDPDLGKELVSLFRQIKKLAGEVSFSAEGYDLLDTIYKNTPPMKDVRFSYYEGRRQTHLLKLCMILAAARLDIMVGPEDVKEANTILIAAESQMPLAIGSFGKSKDIEVRQTILEGLTKDNRPLTKQELMKLIRHDVTSQLQVSQILNGMVEIGLLQLIDLGGNNPVRYAMNKSVHEEWKTELYDFKEYLTPEENLGEVSI